MKKANFTQIAVWLILILNIVGLKLNLLFIKDYSEFQALVWRMDSTQNWLIEELVNANNKTVDNQNQLMEYLKEVQQP